MKFGPRKPNFKKRIKARTTGKMKRKVKKSINPLYGKKGMGWINNPKKAAYNKIYNQTTFDALPSSSNSGENSGKAVPVNGCLPVILLGISLLFPPLFILSLPVTIKNVRDQKKKRKEESFKEGINKALLSLDRVIAENQKIKGLLPFFKRMKKIFALKKQLKNQFDTGLAKNYLKKEEVEEIKGALEETIDQLLIHYIDRYEKDSYEEAMALKTEKGRMNNYQKAYSDLLAYKEYFSPKVYSYIEEHWREIR